MLQESAASSPAKEHKSSRWWFYTPKDSNKGWVVVPDSGAAAVPALASATVRDGGAGGGTIKGSLREGTLLSGADAVDTIGQQVCSAVCSFYTAHVLTFLGWHVRWYLQGWRLP